MNLTLDIENIYSLKNFLNANGKRKEIEEFFTKKRHVSKADQFRPESEKWLNAKKEDEEIAKLPDHNVEFNYETLKLKFSYHEISWSIGKITSNETYYCHNMEEYVQGEVTSNFIIENSHWGYGLICSFDELISHHKVQQMMEIMLDYSRRDKWEKHLKSINDGVFMLLLDKILKSEKELIPVKIFTKIFGDDKWVEIGEQKYHLKDMIEINNAYVNKDYEFYDDNDIKIEYKDYYYESFPDFYLKHKPKLENQPK